MKNKEIRKVVGDLATKYGFREYYGAWLKESAECLIALVLVKSNFSNSYYLRIKIQLKHAYGRKFSIDKNWIKHDIADVILGERAIDQEFLNLDKNIDDGTRIQNLEEMFRAYIEPLTDTAISRKGISELYEKGKISLLPAVKHELSIKN